MLVLLMLTACARAAEGLRSEPSPPLRSVGAPTAMAGTDLAPASASASAALALPVADVPGEDLQSLPRYPGAVRTAYVVSIDEVMRSVASAYLADATVDEVRAFYQGVILEHGWERADIDVEGGEWTYVLISGNAEAVINLRDVEGLVEIDLRLGEPLATPPPPAVPVPIPAPVPTPDSSDDDDD
jgi:hypothetical protein